MKVESEFHHLAERVSEVADSDLGTDQRHPKENVSLTIEP
jgi:hypothetical protein